VQIVATATNSAELLTYARALRPEIVVLESELPGMSLTELLPSLTASDPPARLLVLGRASSQSLVGEADCGAQLVHEPAEILAALDDGAA
jgi:DNA-binding NarL/FixJ family response regulator